MEQQPQPEQEQTQQAEQRFKTLGVRLDEELHTRLSFIAQLSGSSLTEEIRRAIETRVETAQADPELIARAEAVRTEIEREAHARQEAIAGFFGQVAVEGATAPRTGSRGSRGAKPSTGERK
jgi:predicted DNA-binding protein